jgi:hypothetical protein
VKNQTSVFALSLRKRPQVISFFISVHFFLKEYVDTPVDDVEDGECSRENDS